jgi:alpha-galactosidase
MTQKITFIGAGSTIFMKNILGDILHYPALKDAEIALMDIDETRLSESVLVAHKLVKSLNTNAKIRYFSNQKQALHGADFVVVCFQIGGFEPCTVTDFEIPKTFGLEQTIGDTLGVGGIMRGLRTVPHLWAVCEDMLSVCPQAVMLQYVNPMAINTWAISARYPNINQVGLCHSVQGTSEELARDLGRDINTIRYRAAGINHMAFFLSFEGQSSDGIWSDLYPELHQGYCEGRFPTATGANPRCSNYVRYELMKHFGLFVSESSEHFAEYVPWFIKSHRPDLIEKFQIPLDEYPKRCIEQMNDWKEEIRAYENAKSISVTKSHEYAAEIVNAIVTGEPIVIHGNFANQNYIPQLPQGAAVEVPCMVDANGFKPTVVKDIPPQLIALMRTNLNVQELTVAALLKQDRAHIYHAAMVDPHTAAELDLDQITDLVDKLIAAHGQWMPEWLQNKGAI